MLFSFRLDLDADCSKHGAVMPQGITAAPEGRNLTKQSLSGWQAASSVYGTGSIQAGQAASRQMHANSSRRTQAALLPNPVQILSTQHPWYQKGI